MAALQRLLKEASTYAERMTGHPSGEEAAKDLLNALPPTMNHDSKYVYGFIDEPAMIGCADVIRGWPRANIALIGLLLLGEEYRSTGLGRSVYHLVEAKVRRWPEIDTLRISVVRRNDAVLPFWRRMGFVETGEVQPYVYDKVVSESIILTKRLCDDVCARDAAS